MWKFFNSFFREYNAAVFTLKEFMPPSFPVKKVFFVPPTIDPLDKKNRVLSGEVARKIVASFGIDTKKPLITQVSRFDPWKDPFGVLDCFRKLKKKIPDLQLAMVSAMANDDPEAHGIYEKIMKSIKGDRDIFILTNREGVADKEVNAFQSFSDVILQKSTKEGFGLTVSEALWKGTPVVAGNVGGIKLQIKNNINGFLVDNKKECIDKVTFLLNNPEAAHKMGLRGKEVVREKFLLPRLLRDELKIYSRLVA